MSGSENLINLLGIISLLVIIYLSVLLAYKLQKIKELQAAVNKLKWSLDEMDEQAKLIVRTDMELNKTQEELDKKVAGLYVLQKLSREISTTLEEGQIFKRIDAGCIKELGFEKACGFLWEESEKEFLFKINVGFSENELSLIESSLKEDKELYSEFAQLIKNEETKSSLSLPQSSGLKEKLKRLFKADSFILSPLLPKEGSKGLLFVGTGDIETIVNEGDEELITVLSSQLGQALENARLFEKTWHSQQGLEKKVEERTRDLSHLLKQVEEINKRKTDFISSVSHELRTPLTSIKGYASILLTGKLGEVPLDIKMRLEKINRHSDELVHMVNDLLDIARIESGKVIMKTEPLELKKIVEKVSDLLAVQLKEKHIEFASNIPDNANTILADRGQIERVFINIIGNAVKFTPLKGKINVTSHAADAGVRVDVSDTGCGIPAEAQEAIFEEFYRVDNQINQQAKGTGLGLTLVKNIIEAHGGKIWVKSKLDSGSTFSFILPKP